MNLFRSIVPAILLLFVLAGGSVFAANLHDPCDAIEDRTTTNSGECNDPTNAQDDNYICIGGDNNPDTPGTGDTPTMSGYCAPLLPEGPQTAGQVLQIIERIANWFFAIFLAISIIFLVWGAFEFVTGEGNPERVSGAKKRLLYAMIGIGLALLANGVDNVLRSILM